MLFMYICIKIAICGQIIAVDLFDKDKKKINKIIMHKIHLLKL